MEVKEHSAKYLARPRYKQTEIGLIPEDWLNPQLQQIADDDSPICYGIVQVGPFTPNGIPVLAIKNLNLDYSSNIHRASIEVERPYARSRVRPEDVVVSVKGTTGRVGIVPSHFQGNISRDLARIRPRAEIAPRFIYQVLQSELAQRRLANAAVGTTRMELSIAILKQVRIPLPPNKVEQETIADALSDADSLINSLEQLLAKKRQLKQGAMQELLTGKRRLPGFGGKWETKKVGEFAECTSGGTPSTLMPNYWNGAIRWMSSGELNLKTVYEVEGRITEEGLRNSSAKMIPADSVLIGLAGQGKTRGTVAMNRVELCTNQSIAAILPNAAFNSKYLYYNLDARYRELRDLSTGGGGRGGLNLTIIKSLAMPFPELSEQTAIGSTLSDMDAEICAIEGKVGKARQLKQGMMQELLTGRIRLP